MSNKFEDLRDDFKKVEMSQVKLFWDHVEDKRKHFDFADLMFHTLSTKNEEDLVFISDLVNQWHSKAKSENKKVFLEVILALFRIQSYSNQLETLNKQTVSNMWSEKKLNENTFMKLNNEKTKLNLELIDSRKEIELLKKQIQFYEESK